MTSTWHSAQLIKDEHSKIPIKQVYVWFVTADDMVAITGNGKGKYQFPGGKPKNEESRIETMKRELYEEVGIRLNEFKEKPMMFGYYLVENDPNWPDNPKYLQLRYYLFVSLSSSAIQLSVNESIEDKDQMQEARFVPLSTLPEFIPWTKGLKEYEELKLIKGTSKPGELY